LGKWIKDTGFRIQDSGYRIQDTGFRIQDSGSGILDAGFRIAFALQVGKFCIIFQKSAVPSAQRRWFV
jgi:hypothetical protein